MIALRAALAGLPAGALVLLALLGAVLAVTDGAGPDPALALAYAALFAAAAAGAAVGTWQAAAAGAQSRKQAALAGAAAIVAVVALMALARLVADPGLRGLLAAVGLLLTGAGGAALGARTLARRLG